MHRSRDPVVASVFSAALLLVLLPGCGDPPDDPIANAKPEPVAAAKAEVVPPTARPPSPSSPT